MELITILAWLTVVGLPILLLGLMAWGVYWYLNRRKNDPPAELKEMKMEIPEVTGIDEESWNEEVRDEAFVGNHRIVDAGTRVYRIYRSVDRIHWAECDPALTERAACNYADYIKRSNPGEFVRCEDPNGLILFYE